MLKKKSFVKIGRGGSVSKVVKEHYLREDIGCGLLSCKICRDFPNYEPTLAPPPQHTLPADAEKGTDASTPDASGRRGMILIPDTNVILHHLDIIAEHPKLFQDVVILQTVIEEVKGQSMAIYKRLRKLIDQQAKQRMYVFSNENSKACWVERHHKTDNGGDAGENESVNDRNDRAIRKACWWYHGHISKIGGEASKAEVVLLSNDRANRSFCEGEQALYSYHSLSDYCRLIFKGKADDKEFGLVMDKLADASLQEHRRLKSAAIYPPHLAPQMLETKVADGSALKGKLQVSVHEREKGVVNVTIGGREESLTVKGALLMNRALHGDHVYLELLSATDEPAAASGGEEEEKGGDDQTVFEEDATLPLPPPSSSTQPQEGQTARFARVIGIKKRSNRHYCGTIDPATIKPDTAQQTVLLVPLDRRCPKIRIKTLNVEALRGQRLLVSVDGWEAESRHPHGHLVQILGIAGERETESKVILLEHDIASEAFTGRVLACLPAADWVAEKDPNFKDRLDLRALDVCSVDPPGCTDIDDALHARPLPNGNVEIGVHIADVTHFVQPESAIDREAASRCTTVYLVDKRIDMLPSLLGTNLCSLQEGVDRFAFSIIWQIDPKDASIKETRFHRTVIQSKASFEYSQAQELLDSPSPPSPPAAGGGEEKADDLQRERLRSALLILNSVAKVLRAQRMENGALNLASPEIRFTLETETQNPLDVQLKEQKASNVLVEEFMLLANVSVAKCIQSHFPDVSLLRRHPAPPAENFEYLKRALSRHGHSLDVTTSKSLADSLDAIHDPCDDHFNKLVRIMTTRCMYQAQYFASGSVGEAEQFWHYGLAAPIYTHFTSPIRRYADVIVHRLLAASMHQNNGNGNMNDTPSNAPLAIPKLEELEEQCTLLNHRNRQAQQAQRASISLFTHLFFFKRDDRTAQNTLHDASRSRETRNQSAYIIKIVEKGLVVLLTEYGIEGLVVLEEKGGEMVDDHWRLQNGGREFYLFDRVCVDLDVVENAQTMTHKLVITLSADGDTKQGISTDVDGVAERPSKRKSPVHNTQ